MKKQVKEKADIVEFIKEKTFFEYHSESSGIERNRHGFTLMVFSPSNNCDVAIQLIDHFSYF
jgi:hypothetical protein